MREAAKPRKNRSLVIGGLLLAVAGTAFLMLLFGTITFRWLDVFGADPEWPTTVLVLWYMLLIGGILGLVMTLVGIANLLREKKTPSEP
jgi:hypothetical protein